MRGTAACMLLLAAAASATAQPIYRSVGPDGRVTFSDRPTAADAKLVAAAAPTAAGSGPALPYALRQVAERFPVRLYTGPDCAPCDAARQHLLTRGVPFEERTVQTDRDIQALQRLAGDSSVPVLTIGAQRLDGFAPQEWTRYLDAAGYPPTSQLPNGYRNAPAQPLVALPPAAPGAPGAPAVPAPSGMPAASPAGATEAATAPAPVRAPSFTTGAAGGSGVPAPEATALPPR